MIVIDLIKALKEQMDICKNTDKYICYVFVNSKKHMDIVRNVLSNIIERPNRDISLQAEYTPEAKWSNGSVMRIAIPNENVRGIRCAGIVIDNDIDINIVRTCILPRLIIINNKPKMFYVGISMDDLDKSKQYKQVYISTGWRSNNLFIDEFTFANQKSFEKEYECMWISNEYNTPIRTIEKENNKILVFNALGIPKENIEYKTEFVNKSKESYLVIQGSVELTDLNYENGINVRMKIDTDIYDGYDVCIENGLIFVRLHEIINEAPVLKDYGVA